MATTFNNKIEVDCIKMFCIGIKKCAKRHCLTKFIEIKYFVNFGLGLTMSSP